MPIYPWLYLLGALLGSAAGVGEAALRRAANDDVGSGSYAQRAVPESTSLTLA
jgi:hypothetical protein